MPNKYQLETRRCRLIPFSIKDFELFHCLNNTDTFIRKYIWDNEIIDLATVNEILAQNQKHFEQDQYGIWKLEFKENRKIIGYVGLWHFFDEPQPQLIYALLEAYTGHGLATETARCVLQYVFYQLKFNYLIAATDEPNLASQKVAQAIGMNFVEKRIENSKPILFYKIEKLDFGKIQ